jgi:hypothetical protein
MKDYIDIYRPLLKEIKKKIQNDPKIVINSL